MHNNCMGLYRNLTKEYDFNVYELLGINFCFRRKPQQQMFLLVSGRHVGAPLYK